MTFDPSTDIPPPTRLNQAALARLLGISRQSINELVTRGILTVGEDRLIDVQQARTAIAHRMRPDSKALAAILDRAPETPPPEPAPHVQAPTQPAADQPASDQNKPDPTVTSFHVARTLDMTARAKRAQLDLAQKQNLLLEREQIERDLYAIARELRDRHTNTARRISAELANATTADDCERILLREFNSMLTDTVTALAKTTLGPDIATALDLA